ncbi:MAG: DUF4160 domain-containing protein [Chloroflexota bacterium]|nr:DUF4160 domain-containing protein [Chloroflexota bacterium]
MTIDIPRVHEEKGYKVYIYTNEHPPPHVHVLVGDGVVVITLDETATLVRASDATQSEIRKAREVVLANLGKLLQAWTSLHGAQ